VNELLTLSGEINNAGSLILKRRKIKGEVGLTRSDGILKRDIDIRRTLESRLKI
jgi:hypothetical protein